MENTLQNSMQSSNLNEYMIQKRIEIMMDIANKNIVSELNNINLKVTKLNEEVIELRKKFSEVQTKPSVILESENKKNQADLKSIKTNEQVSKPRYGDYTPEDVKIDKFFYFGNKK